MKLNSIIYTGLAAIFSASFAQAGPESSGKAPPPMAPAPEPADWWFRTAAYGWLGAVEGDIGLRGITASADMGIDDLIDDLDFAYMGYFEAGKGRWSGSLDFIYARLSDDASFGTGAFTGAASVEEEQIYLTGRVNYRAIDTEAARLTVFAGARWTFLDVDLNIDTVLGDRRFDASHDFVDPVIGLNAEINLSEKWYLFLGGDIGGFGVESDLTWQANADIGYRFTPKLSAFAGYRALGVDYEKDDFKLDTTMYGPIIGLIYKF